MGRRRTVLALVVAAALAGVPVAGDDCSPGDGCPMAGVGCSSRAAACPRGPVWSVAMTCCGAPATPATAPADVATIAPAAPLPAPLAAAVERAPEPPAPAPTAPAAERSRAERRHAVGLFTLFLVLLN
jgi:2-oxoglutarate dehydrogenase E2 component (dihydrolipoamide succinyltransferase)